MSRGLLPRWRQVAVSTPRSAVAAVSTGVCFPGFAGSEGVGGEFAYSFLTQWHRQVRAQSAFTLTSPHRRNCRTPMQLLIWPNTGSTVYPGELHLLNQWPVDCHQYLAHKG